MNNTQQTMEESLLFSMDMKSFYKKVAEYKALAEQFSAKDNMVELTIRRAYDCPILTPVIIKRGGLMGAMVNAGEEYIIKELKRLNEN